MGGLSSQPLRLFFSVSSFSLLILLANSLSSSQPLSHDQEKLALLQFKQSFRSDCQSALNPSSAYPKTDSWQNVGTNESANCCAWEGVECDEETGYVTGLDLSSSCLHGTFPSNSTLFSLTHLEKLNLADNDFNFSQIPTAIGDLDRLTSLNLSSSAFSGQIPSQISKFSRLSVLDLSFNGDRLGGIQFNLKLHDPSLHKLVQTLTRLSQLYLDGVDISSSVHASLANLTSLRAISLAFCNLQGEFPKSVFLLPRLETMFLAYNGDLQGSLPEFPPTSRLKRLFLISTGFSGVLPPSIGNLGSLEILELWNSHFTGLIPSSIGNLTKLTVLDLGYNNFIGDIPSSITNLKEIHTLDISRLNVRPENLVSWLLKVHKLTQLGLGRISLAGEIPTFLANLTNLTYLDLSSNQLVGPIPYWFSNLTQLNSLHIEENQLQGPIPNWFPRLINLGALNISYNNFFGQFDTFLKFKKLRSLDVSGVNLTFPSNISNSSSVLQFNLLGLDECKLTEFPQFLYHQNKLQFLSLSGNNIMGKIPQWFVDETADSLLSIDLSKNLLTGFEQPHSVIPWKRLETLDLSFNRLQGSLTNPSDYLLTYQVSNNQLTGVIPEQICNARSLYVLDLSNNNMSGQIPSCISDHLGTSLLVLNLRGNNFHGTIPPTYTQSCQLKMIDLSQNQLEGDLPRSLRNCNILEVLDIGQNRANDTFPSWLGSLPKLEILILRHNNFHGGIATSNLGLDFPSLRIIDLSSNYFGGALPAGYFQNWKGMKVSEEDQLASSGITVDIHLSILQEPHMINDAYKYSMRITNKGNEILFPRILNVLKVIDLSSNKFTGMIPISIGNLTGLQALNLSNNNLDGIIPQSLAYIKGLESLDLSQNKLSGQIPDELTKLTSLEVFNVSYNHLEGLIPQGEQFSTFDNSSYVGNFGLCGSPLSKECGNKNPPQAPPSVTNDEEEDSDLIDWIIRLLGCVSGCIVGFVFGKCYITDKYHDWFIMTFGRRKRPKKAARRAPPYRWG